MDELNKLQGPLDNTSGQPSNEPLGSGQYPKESTYWEAAQTPEVPETPEQFYQYYQQQINKANPPEQNPGQQLYTQPYLAHEIYDKPPKKKARRKVFPIFIILLLILAGGATAYAFQDTLLNTFALYTKSPVDYYAYVEKRALLQSVDELKPYLNLTSQKTAYDVSTNITFERETLDSLMQSSLGMSLEDFESSLGIPIESIGLDVLYGKDQSLMNETLGVRLNEVNLITLELFMDTIKQDVLLRLPELSPAYLKQSLGTGNNPSSNLMDQLEVLTPERNADFLNRYGNIIVDHVTQIELKKNVELTLNKLSEKCNKLTVTLTEEDLYNMTLAILEEAREDEYIQDVLPMLNMTKEVYQQAIDDAKSRLASSYDGSFSETNFQMLVYVDSQGNIIGRELSSKDSPSALGYTFLTKDNYNEFDAYLKDDTGNALIKVVGNQTKDQIGYDGAITVDCTSTSSELLDNFSFDIEYDDFRREMIDNRFYQYGSCSLSSLDLMGIQVMMDYSVNDDIQYNKLVIQLGVSPLVTIDTKIDYLEDYQVVMPPETAEIYDSTQAESYLASLNIKAHLEKLSEQLGVDLQSIFNLYLPGFIS